MTWWCALPNATHSRSLETTRTAAHQSPLAPTPSMSTCLACTPLPLGIYEEEQHIVKVMFDLAAKIHWDWRIGGRPWISKATFRWRAALCTPANAVVLSI